MSKQIITKKCCHCKQDKSFSDFHKNKNTYDGYHFACKICHSKSVKEYSKTKRGKDTHKRASSRYQKTEKGKSSQKRYYFHYPERRKAVNAVNNAIIAGRLDPPYRCRCFMCRFKRAKQYHHPDYNNPLFVFPVCIDCHCAIHS